MLSAHDPTHKLADRDVEHLQFSTFHDTLASVCICARARGNAYTRGWSCTQDSIWRKVQIRWKLRKWKTFPAFLCVKCEYSPPIHLPHSQHITTSENTYVIDSQLVTQKRFFLEKLFSLIFSTLHLFSCQNLKKLLKALDISISMYLSLSPTTVRNPISPESLVLSQSRKMQPCTGCPLVKHICNSGVKRSSVAKFFDILKLHKLRGCIWT